MACMHVMIKADCHVVVNKMLLRDKDKVACKFCITDKRSDTLNDISEVDFKCLAGHNDLTALEAWTSRDMLIYQLV